MEHDITYDKQQNEEERKSDCRLPAPTSHQSAPLAAQFKEEDSHEHITQPQEQGIAQSKKPIADEAEEEIETGTIVLNHGRGTPEETMAPFFEKVDSNVGSKEANQEPCRIVTIKAAVHPDMRPFEGLDRMVVTVDEERQEGKIDGPAYESGRQVRNEEALSLIYAILAAGPENALIEITRLEEKEGHEIICPLHNLTPPFIVGVATHGHHVQTNHPDNADATQKVESVVARFHVCKITKYLLIVNCQLSIISYLCRMKLAPVALFVFNRADNTRKTLEALARNTLALDTTVYVFSDGGKDEATWALVRQVRAIVREFSGSFASLRLVERPVNYYLERNITEGIAEVFEQHDRIIVLEDDIVTSPHYLQYMNDAFNLYRDVPRVMHIAGFTNLALPDVSFYFTPHMSGWGWGTWKDRWNGHFLHFENRQQALQGLTEADLDHIQYGGVFPCLKSLDKRPIPWDICWELAIYRAGGLCLTPGCTMVRNIGLNQGTHFRSFSLLQWYEFDREPSQEPLPLTRIEHPEKNESIEQLFAQAITDWGIRYTLLGRIIRYFYKRLCKQHTK